MNHDIPLEFCELDPNDILITDENDSEAINSTCWMKIISKTLNKFNVDFGGDDFESVNQEIYLGTYANEIKSDDLDVIPKNIKSIKELMAHSDRMEYFVTNNTKVIIDISTKYELLELEVGTLLS